MENVKEDLYTKFVNAIREDIGASESIQDAEDIAADFAIDFSEISAADDNEDSQREVWLQLADEFLLDTNVVELAEKYGAELYKAIIRQGEIFLQ